MQGLPVEGIDTLPLCNPSCPRLAANLTLYFLRFSLFVYKTGVSKKEIYPLLIFSHFLARYSPKSSSAVSWSDPQAILIIHSTIEQHFRTIQFKMNPKISAQGRLR